MRIPPRHPHPKITQKEVSPFFLSLLESNSLLPSKDAGHPHGVTGSSFHGGDHHGKK
jgi:hypothetical protein